MFERTGLTNEEMISLNFYSYDFFYWTNDTTIALEFSVSNSTFNLS